HPRYVNPYVPPPPEAVDDGQRHLAGPVALVAVHLVAEERPQGLEEGPGPRLLLRIRPRVGMDEVETELAVEQVTNEALRPPFRFAGGLGDLAGLAGTDLRFRHGSDSTRPRARIPGGLNAAEGRPPRHLRSAPCRRRGPEGRGQAHRRARPAPRVRLPAGRAESA